MYLGKIYKTKEREFKVSDMEEAPETDATIKIRLLSPGERKEVFQASFKTVYTADETGEMKPEMKSEHYKMAENIFMKAVTGWTDFFEDEEGNIALKFGNAGKKKLLAVVPEIADFVADCHKQMVDEEIANTETIKKNLSDGSNASKTNRPAKNAKK
ncbi:MAG: hypothetical protein DRH26_15570 [Deltaproteobacteria bacterium]|nr:MAG: hypothetical protein DRH26_15570 [Deltaproteobacteria bacterium]